MSQDLKVDGLQEAKNILERNHKVWEYFARDVYNSQMGNIKTYLWLSITLLTAQAMMYSRFETLVCISPLHWYSYLLIGAVLTAFIALMVGMSCLSMIFLGRTLQQYPFPATSWEFENLEYKGIEYDYNNRYACLKEICKSFDLIYEQNSKLITRRGYRMRVQCICCMCSALFSFIFVVIALLSGG